MRKAQIQNMESIAVVIIIGIMIVLGLVFAFNFKSEDTKQEIDTQRGVQALTIALKASSLEELKCSSFSSSGNLCLDLLTLLAVSEYVTQDNAEAYKYYYDQFKMSFVNITMIYPVYEGDIEVQQPIKIFDFAPEVEEGKIMSVRSIYYPVLVQDPITNTYYFSIMEVGVYS